MNFEQFFNIYNIIFFLFLVLIIYLVYTDDRFKLNRKFIFLSIVVVLFLISYYLDKVPYLIIKDLFWYSLVLNGSFVFHVLILSRIFHFCWEKHYEYLGFIISRISFTLSFSWLLYILSKIYNKLQKFWMENYIEANNFSGKILNPIIKIIQSFINILKSIIINFSIIFHNYSLLLLGKNINKFDIKNIIKYIIVFLIFFAISIIIGIPRLYIIWSFQILLESYKILNREYFSDFEEFSKFNILEKYKYTYNKYKMTGYLYNYYKYKVKELYFIYEKPYHKFFMFDLCRFLDNNPNYLFIWSLNSDRIDEYPLKNIYKFYPWGDLALRYCDIDKNNIIFDYDQLKNLIKWTQLINKDYKFIKQIFPEIKKEEYEYIKNNN